MSEDREKEEDENVNEMRKIKKRRSMSEWCIFGAKGCGIYKWRNHNYRNFKP